MWDCNGRALPCNQRSVLNGAEIVGQELENAGKQSRYMRNLPAERLSGSTWPPRGRRKPQSIWTSQNWLQVTHIYNGYFIRRNMLGAIVGDIVGSVYEWNNIKRRIFRCLDDCYGWWPVLWRKQHEWRIWRMTHWCHEEVRQDNPNAIALENSG